MMGDITQGDQIFISGGRSQGLAVGDQLRVMKPGKSIQSQQSGFDIQLPPTEIARLRISALFGDSDTNEGAVCTLVQGSLKGSWKKLMVMEGK